VVDLIHDHSEPREFLGLSLLLRGCPKLLVAGHTTDLERALAVRNLAELLVAFHAHPFAVDALLETVLHDVERVHLPVRPRRSEPFVSVAGQADFVGEVRRLCGARYGSAGKCD